MDLSHLDTEQANESSTNFSAMSISESIQLMNMADAQAVDCIKAEFNHIEQVIKLTANALQNKHRIVYIGAGTSGRLGVLDAAECRPTFGVDDNTVVGLLAGGEPALVHAVEGVEDEPEQGENDLKQISFQKEDVLIGIAASGRTPYVIGALRYAKSLGAKTCAIVCTQNSLIAEEADITIAAVPGPEILTGSTRLKAGTTTKLILNMISTISMKEIGKVYKNYMVDLQISNKKLQQRAVNIIKAVTSCSEEMAKNSLEQAKGSVKVAIVMVLLQVGYQDALTKLQAGHEKIENLIK